jgi:hypothetical protein
MSLRLIVCAAFVALAAASPAVAADGEDSGTAGAAGAVEVTPASPRPGDEVELRVTGCEDGHGVARSAAFVAEATLAPGAESGGLVGEARVGSTVPSGDYPVEVSCDGKETKVTGHLTVGGGGEGGGGGDGGDSAPGGPDQPQQPTQSTQSTQSSEPTLPTQPTAPVRAGGGGMAADPGSAGARLSIGPAGLALLSGALVSCTMLTVRRRTRRK